MNTVIKNKKSFQQKLAILKKAGPDSLHIITDFDKTLTTPLVKGKGTSLSYQPLDNSFRTKEYRKQVSDLFHKYHPIEKDPMYTESQKAKLMLEWWEKYFALARQHRITEKHLNAQARKLGLPFRKGIKEFFRILHEKNVPVLVFSGGIENVIGYFLKKLRVYSPNIHILANRLIFDDKDYLTDFGQPLIHSFNKDERHIKNTKYKKQIEKRKNVILLGDAIEDIAMAKGMHHDCLLKIGFLNEGDKKSIKEFSEAFDVVILNDGDFSFINKVMKEIIGEKSRRN